MRWSIGLKIGSGFAFGLAALIVLGVLSFRNATGLIRSSEEVNLTRQILQGLESTTSLLTDAAYAGRGYVITGDSSYLEPYNGAKAAIDSTLKDLARLVRDPGQRTRLEGLGPLVNARLGITAEQIEVRRSTGFKAAQELVLTGKGERAQNEVRQAIGTITAEENRLLDERNAGAKRTAGVTVAVILYGIPVAIVLLALISFLLIRNISRPLAELTRSAGRIAAGDLQAGVHMKARSDEIGILGGAFRNMTQFLGEMAGAARSIAAGDLTTHVKPQSDADVLGNAFAEMINSLRRITVELQQGIGTLGTSVSEILATTTQIATGAAETATGVSETTTTVEEVKQTSLVASQKARAVMEGAQRAVQISQSGSKSVAETLEGMNRIREQMGTIAASIVRLSEHSQAIAEIIMTVNDLAEQSNLLAVNAGIEAAKAGEQGRGFAVVAQEVKYLAEQSKQATAQVRGILGEVQKATSAAVMATEQGTKVVEAGVTQSATVSETIRMLTESVSEAAQASMQIAATSQQQLVGMGQVAQAMESIKTATTQNVAGTKQAGAAAQQLGELGETLRQLIAGYKV